MKIAVFRLVQKKGTSIFLNYPENESNKLFPNAGN
jgi:hypothetical protein